MNNFLLVAISLLLLTMSAVSYPDGAITSLVVLLAIVIIVSLIRKNFENSRFVLNVFILGLLLRLCFGLLLHMYDLRDVFAGDAETYNYTGARLAEIWQGLTVPNDVATWRAMKAQNFDIGWGMFYFVGIIYYIFGANILLAQSICGVIGACLAPMIYYCSKQIYNNDRVAKVAALLVTFIPAFIIWTSQLLKDGLIVFLLLVVMTVVIQLQKKFSFAALFILILSLIGILSLRSYIFYMVVFSVVGSFFVGSGSSGRAIARNVAFVLILGLTLTYLGVIRNAGSELGRYSSLQEIQHVRGALVDTADSGYGEDLDVSTPIGALTAIPVGFTYLMLAPFPWQAQKINQILILPEMFLWWAFIPFLIAGIWYTLKNRLITAIPILVFTLMLTIAYSIFQGNVGMAYRQRTQIQIFLFIFIAVGWSMIQERSENKIIKRQINEERLRRKLKARSLEIES